MEATDDALIDEETATAIGRVASARTEQKLVEGAREDANFSVYLWARRVQVATQAARMFEASDQPDKEADAWVQVATSAIGRLEQLARDKAKE